MYRLIYVFLTVSAAASQHLLDRDALLNKEELKMLGSSIILTAKEEAANRILLAYKTQEYEEGVANPERFNPARHFFQARGDIEASKVFRIIRGMPKGASLHAHDLSTISQEYFLNLTYREHAHGCIVDDELHLRFMRSPNRDAACNWTLLSDWRAEQPNFEAYLKEQYFLNVENPRVAYPSSKAVWRKMWGFFRRYAVFLGYKPVFQEQFYQSLLELYNDNVRYYEFRTSLEVVYELDGRVYSPLEVAGLYKETLERFKASHADFTGARLIYVMLRSAEPTDLQLLNELHQAYPDFFAGFDICGEEDAGKPLHHFTNFVNEVPPVIKRFFHAAETNWYGSTDHNLIDAILLNTSRIGHGFGLTKHPSLLKLVKKRRIAIEVCPISNQVLMLVEDLRNHPAVTLLAWGYPVVIGNDNPTFWGATGLSYDFYAAFMGMTSKTADLKVLKQLALNSVEYSAMSVVEKAQALLVWRQDWEKFLDVVIAEESVSRDEL